MLQQRAKPPFLSLELWPAISPWRPTRPPPPVVRRVALYRHPAPLSCGSGLLPLQGGALPGVEESAFEPGGFWMVAKEVRASKKEPHERALTPHQRRFTRTAHACLPVACSPS